MARDLSTAEAERFYDRFGAKQDAQAFYEDPALDRLLRKARLQDARRLFEFGCGTGRLAERMLDAFLPPDATYAACDISAVMIELARARLARFGPRVTLWKAEEPVDFRGATEAYDRVITTYVLDLLDDATERAAIAAAHRALVPGGLFAHVGLTFAPNGIGWATSRLWNAIQHVAPTLVGGCRPRVVADRLDPSCWAVVSRDIVVAWGIPSEVVVARKIA